MDGIKGISKLGVNNGRATIPKQIRLYLGLEDEKGIKKNKMLIFRINDYGIVTVNEREMAKNE